MFDISRLFISPAWAQVTDSNATTPSSGGLSDFVSPQMLMFLAIFMVFYVLVIRPQQKKAEAQEKMIKALRRGDRVITSSGIHGKISKLDDAAEHVMLEIADGMHIKLLRSHVAALEAKTDPAPVANDADGQDKKS